MNYKKFILILSLLAIVLVAIFVFFSEWFNGKWKNFDSTSDKYPLSHYEAKGFKAFESPEDFKNYLSKASSASSFWGRGGAVVEDQALSSKESVNVATPEGLSKEIPQRYSETNVQVSGIDEPDIVKTDGEKIYFSPEEYYFAMPMMEKANISDRATGLTPPVLQQNKLKILDAFPPEELKKIGEIEKNGKLLLVENILVIFSGQKIYGYDISDLKSPQEKWNVELKGNTNFSDARLYKGNIYFISQTSAGGISPCPLKPFSIKGNEYSIECARIYHPQEIVSAELIYNLVKINPRNGEVQKTISFTGSYGDSTLYMSGESVYVAYFYQGNVVSFWSDFMNENKGMFPAEAREKMKKLSEYDISEESKINEFQKILNGLYGSLSEDESLKFKNEMMNKMDSYFKERKREVGITQIAKLTSENLEITASGTVPGKILNQFSLDEYDKNLRVATTVGENWPWTTMGPSGSAITANDVYILNEKMKEVGSIKELGLEEKIYSARFIGDKGYLVTFRQTDPFYILDLKDPKNPVKSGELKIPGYSSYLHPLSKNLILGIGKEDANVKLSLFDVSDPQNPQEVSKYNLDEYWSEILNTHHAFLADPQKSAFFLPGSKGGYVFSYDNNELKLEKAISGNAIKRAVYIDHYLYILGEEITVLDENDGWKEVKNLEL